MIVTKKSLPAEHFLRGVGATLSLPLLDAMIPAMTAVANTPASPSKLHRHRFRLHANGLRYNASGRRQVKTLDELSPTLMPLERVKNKVAILSIMELKNAYPGTHATSNSSFLSAATAKRTESTEITSSVQRPIKLPPSKSARIRNCHRWSCPMDLLSVVGQCDNGYACVYQTIFRGRHQPLHACGGFIRELCLSNLW